MQHTAAAEASAGDQGVRSAGTPAPPKAPPAPKRKREESSALDSTALTTGADELSFEEVRFISLDRLERTCSHRACSCSEYGRAPGVALCGCAADQANWGNFLVSHSKMGIDVTLPLLESKVCMRS